MCNGYSVVHIVYIMDIVCGICNQRDCYGYSMHVFMERAWMGGCVCVCFKECWCKMIYWIGIEY